MNRSLSFISHDHTSVFLVLKWNDKKKIIILWGINWNFLSRILDKSQTDFRLLVLNSSISFFLIYSMSGLDRRTRDFRFLLSQTMIKMKVSCSAPHNRSYNDPNCISEDLISISAEGTGRMHPSEVSRSNTHYPRSFAEMDLYQHLCGCSMRQISLMKRHVNMSFPQRAASLWWHSLYITWNHLRR